MKKYDFRLRQDRFDYIIDTYFRGRQVELARSLDTSPGYLSQIKSGERAISKEIGLKFINLKINPIFLDEGKGEPVLSENNSLSSLRELQIKLSGESNLGKSNVQVIKSPQDVIDRLNEISNFSETGETRVVALSNLDNTDIEVMEFSQAVGAGKNPFSDAEARTVPLKDLFGSGNNYMVKVSGDSMTAAGISPGDKLIIDRSLNHQHNDIVVDYVNGELLVKRLVYIGDDFFLWSDNTKYPPIPINGNDKVEIFGILTNIIKNVPRGRIRPRI